MARKSTEWLFRWDPSAGAQLGPLLRHWYEYCSAGIAGVSQNETTDSGHSKLARWLVGEVDASELGAIHRVRLRGPGAILEVHVVLEADPHEPGAIIGRPVDAGNLPYWSSAIIASDLLQELPDPIVVVDEQDRIVYVNQPGADLSGMLAQELLGKPVSVFRSLTAKPADPLAEGFSPASGSHFDLPLVSKDGRYLLLKVRPVDLGIGAIASE
jgi:PAS domain S-box-containing protein